MFSIFLVEMTCHFPFLHDNAAGIHDIAVLKTKLEIKINRENVLNKIFGKIIIVHTIFPTRVTNQEHLFVYIFLCSDSYRDNVCFMCLLPFSLSLSFSSFCSKMHIIHIRVIMRNRILPYFIPALLFFIIINMRNVPFVLINLSWRQGPMTEQGKYESGSCITIPFFPKPNGI